MQIDRKLSIDFYRVGSTSFSDAQIDQMVIRTNAKLSSAGIEIRD